MHVDGASIAVPVVAPDAVEDLLARQGEPGTFGQEAQEVELLGGELDRSVGDQHFAPARVDGHRTGLHDLGRSGAVDPAQHRLDASDELGGGERLGEVVVAAELEAEHAVDLAVARGEEDHRDLRGLAQPTAHLQPVDVGQTDVEHDEAGPVRADRLEARFAGRRLEHPVPVAGEVEVDEIGDVGLVVDDDDGSPFHGAMVARHRPRTCEGTVIGT